MSLTIATNVHSMTAARSVAANTFDLRNSIEKLATGSRLNRAGDDEAAAAVADSLTSEINGIRKALQGAQDGISLAQTIDGALVSISENLQRIRELFVQAANGTLSADESDALQREVNSRVTNIEDIASNTTFNGLALLQGGSDITLQTGAHSTDTTTLVLTPAGSNTGINIAINEIAAAGAADDGEILEGVSAGMLGIGLDDIHITGATGVNSLAGNNYNPDLADFDIMIGNVARMRSSVGSFENALESKLSFLQDYQINLTSSRSRIKDLDIASESSNLSRSQILQNTALASLSQANTSSEVALSLLP